jgi:DNA-binding transcriptional MerR regulator
MDPSSFEEDVDSRLPSSLEELLELIADARRHGLSDEDLRRVVDLLRAGSATVVAAERDVTARTIRNHRARAVHEIRRTACAA